MRSSSWGALASGVVLALALLVPAPASGQQPTIGRPWLGVAMDTDPDGQGARVGHVVRGSPAEVAGIHEGDRILRVQGRPVASAPDVVHAVAGLSVGQNVEIVVARPGGEKATVARLAALPAQDQIMRMDLVGGGAPALRDTHAISGAFPDSLASLRGRVVVLDFWATWCAPCRLAAPMLDSMQSRYGAQGLSVLGVASDDPQDLALFAQRMSLHYGIGADRHGQTSRAYGVFSLPTLVLIDKRGIVREVSLGYDPGGEAHLESAVRALLAEPGDHN